MMRKPIDNISNSVKMKKGQKSRYGIDDYNIVLPDDA
jgi:hypothetical protein